MAMTVMASVSLDGLELPIMENGHIPRKGSFAPWFAGLQRPTSCFEDRSRLIPAP